MNTKEFIEHLDNSYALDDLIDDMFWSGRKNYSQFRSFVIRKAEATQIILTDLESFNFDACLDEIWQHTEKGLS